MTHGHTAYIVTVCVLSPTVRCTISIPQSDLKHSTTSSLLCGGTITLISLIAMVATSVGCTRSVLLCDCGVHARVEQDKRWCTTNAGARALAYRSCRCLDTRSDRRTFGHVASCIIIKIFMHHHASSFLRRRHYGTIPFVGYVTLRGPQHRLPQCHTPVRCVRCCDCGSSQPVLMSLRRHL